MQRLHFNVCDVAALIGRHKYRSRAAVLLDILLKRKAAALAGTKGLVSDDVLVALSDMSVLIAAVNAQP